MALYRVSLMYFEPTPEKEKAFWDWYEHHHIPYLFTGRPGWKRVRMCQLNREIKGPELLRPYSDPTGQPPYLNILEQYITPPPGAAAPRVGEVSEGQRDFVDNWLPHLRYYGTVGYECVVEKVGADFGQDVGTSTPYDIGIMRYDVVPEKENAFHQWYDDIHMPEMFNPRRGWRALRRCVLTQERGGSPLLQRYRLTEGQPKNLIIQERDLGGATPPPKGQVRSSVADFVKNWLPHLRNYTSIDYTCQVDASPTSFKGR